MTVVGSFVLYRYVRDRADMPGRRLDEREKELRDRAWILSYQVLSAVVVAAVILIGIAVFVLGRAVTFDASLVNAIVLSVAVLLPILPAAALAWIEPDPVEEA
jgi:membrane-associated protease RseP (regulator of RpoE activity)